MTGITNVVEQRNRYNVDEHTLFLLTDSLEDKSIYKQTFDNVGVTETDVVQRDNRNSLYFNGSSHLIMTNKLDYFLGTNWTCELWFYQLSGSTTGIVHHRMYTGTRNGMILWSDANNLKFYLGNNNSTTAWNVTNNKQIRAAASVDDWRHLAIVKSDKTFYAFENGNLYTTWSFTANYMQEVLAVTIGGYKGTDAAASQANVTQHIKGYIQDFRISNIARYTAAFTPPQRLI